MIERTTNPLVLAALGTSLTARGAWLQSFSASSTYVSGRPVRTLNFAKVGATSRWGLKIANEVAQAHPDIAIIEFAINDAALHRRVSLSESGTNVTAIVRRLRAAQPDVWLYLMTMSPAIGLSSLLRPRLTRYYDLYATIAAREHAGYIDNRADWKSLSRTELAKALPDGTHPSAQFSISITLTNVLRALQRDFGQR